jgi:hypothetical protein
MRRCETTGTRLDSIDVFLDISGSYVTPITVIFGCVNNILVLVVLSLPQYNKHVTCLYLRVLAVFDTITITCLGVVLTNNVMATLILKIGTPFCATLSFLLNSTPELSSWMILAITGTRFIAVAFPLKAAAWTTLRGATIFIALGVLAFFLLALPDW